jgi:predicted nucleotidyltransferase
LIIYGIALYLSIKEKLMNIDHNIITKKIKDVVKKTDPSAQLILYGSRARGEAKSESDWDVLILLNKMNVTVWDEQKFRHQLYDVELETGQAISTLVYSKQDWETKLSVTPLYHNIKKEGIYL